MNPRYEKLKNLLRELFQLNEPDLDFGLYRIMRAKSVEVTKFLDEELLPQVQEAFSRYRSADKEETEQELHRAIEQATALGLDPEATPKVRELREKVAATSVDVAALESEVYDHLYSFFRRYYAEGDFLSKRVYKPGVYAIPYEGEEVKLYWANYDQYYIKTSEYLREYSFRLNPGNEANSMRVHFRLVDATEGEHGNIKEQEGKKRRFKLAQEHPVAIEHGELVVRFTFEPQPEEQKELNAAAERTILSMTDPALVPWLELLQKPHKRSDGTVSDSTRLRVHVDRYTARNTFDYFIHKDLGTFLRRELDFYIKNEVMHLDDIEQEGAPRVEQYLSKIKVIRSIAGKIIDFLAQLEDFQKKLWLKKKFVTETSWCIRIGIIPEEFYPEIARTSAQWDEWNALHHFEGEAFGAAAGELFAAQHGPGTIEFLKAHPTLMIDTRHFSADFTDRLLSALGDIDEQTDGVLVHSENFQALNLMQRKYRQKIKCVYIDPPYNSKTTEILYKNDYKHSSWLSLMDNRLMLSKFLASAGGSHIIAIDENEQEVLGRLISNHFQNHEKICIAIIHNKKGIQGNYFSYNHDYAYFCIPFELSEAHGKSLEKSEWEYSNLRKWGRESERETARNCFYPIYVEGDQIVGFGKVCDDSFHPGKSNIIENKANNRIAVYPVDSQGIERKWRYARQSIESIKHLLKVYVTTSGEIQILKAKSEIQPKTVWDDSRYIAGDYGTKWLTDLGIKIKDDLYPKSIYTVMCIPNLLDLRYSME